MRGQVNSSSVSEVRYMKLVLNIMLILHYIQNANKSNFRPVTAVSFL